MIPLARPAAPTLTALTGGDTYLNATFGAANLNGSALVTYQYQLNGGAWVNTQRDSGHVPDHQPDQRHGVHRRDARGHDGRQRRRVDHVDGDAVRPPVRAGHHDVTTSPANGGVVVSWTPAANNGSAITGYTATAFTLAANGSAVGTAVHHDRGADLHGDRPVERHHLLLLGAVDQRRRHERSDRTPASPAPRPRCRVHPPRRPLPPATLRRR